MHSDWSTNDPTGVSYIKNRPPITYNRYTSNTKVVGDFTVSGNISGAIDYSHLTNVPATASFANVASTGSYNDLSNKPTYANVATTGSYTDLINTPSIPSPSQWTTSTGNITCGLNVNCGANLFVNTALHIGQPALRKFDMWVDHTTERLIIESNYNGGQECMYIKSNGSMETTGSIKTAGLAIGTSSYLAGCITMSGNIYLSGDISPNAANVGQIGYSTVPFNRGYMQNGVVTTSDGRLKSSVSLPYGLHEIMQIEPIAYKWKTQSDLADTDPEKHHIYYGVDARQIHDSNILPELCYAGDTLTINYSELIPVLINAVKEQQKQIEELQTALRSMKSNIAFTPVNKNISGIKIL